jgi:hypothetical protein
MIIVLHHSKFYDDVPVPSDVKVTPQDISSGKVKPSANGGWTMRTTREVKEGTITTVALPEHEIAAKVIEEKLRRGSTVNRKQAVALYLREYTLPAHAHPSWLTNIEMHDSGPDEQVLRAALDRHVEAGHIDAADVAEHVSAYMQPATPEDHITHLSTHFRLAKKAVAQ